MLEEPSQRAGASGQGDRRWTPVPRKCGAFAGLAAVPGTAWGGGEGTPRNGHLGWDPKVKQEREFRVAGQEGDAAGRGMHVADLCQEGGRYVWNQGAKVNAEPTQALGGSLGRSYRVLVLIHPKNNNHLLLSFKQ